MGIDGLDQLQIKLVQKLDVAVNLLQHGIDKNGLAEAAGCDLSPLTGSDAPLDSWNTPRSISTQCSFTKRGRDYLITASGGVQIESWQVAEKVQVDPRVKKVYAKAAKSNGEWWQ